MCLSTPKVPSPPSPPPLAAEDDEAIRARQDAERRRLRLARGRSATILTGGLGDPQAAVSAAKTLLGQ
jgi:hypothetical protein